MKIPAQKPYLLPVVTPVRYEHIAYEGELWFDATGRMLDAAEVCNAVNWLAEQSVPE